MRIRTGRSACRLTALLLFLAPACTAPEAAPKVATTEPATATASPNRPPKVRVETEAPPAVSASDQARPSTEAAPAPAEAAGTKGAEKETKSPPSKEPQEKGASNTPPPSPEERRKAFLERARRYREAVQAVAEARKALREKKTREAHDALDRALALQPGLLQAAVLKAALLRKELDWDGALAVLEDALALNPGNASLLYDKAVTLKEAGRFDAALKLLDDLAASGRPNPNAQYLRAVIFATQGDNASALAALEAAVEQGFSNADRMEGERAFEPIRNEPRYRELLRQLEERRREYLRQIEEGLRAQEAERPPEAQYDVTPAHWSAMLDSNIRFGRGEPIEIELEALDGRKIRLPHPEGKAAVVFAFGTWSKKCRDMFPGIAGLENAPGLEDVAVYLLANQLEAGPPENPDGIREHLKRAGLRFPCALITTREALGIGVSVYPTTLFIGRDGKVYLRAAGFLEGAAIKSLAQQVRDGTAKP